MQSIWFYDTSGTPAYYQQGDNIYAPNGRFAYYESNGWWFSADGGSGDYYISGKWIYSKDGDAAFYRT